jgi:hypothetical protein
MFCLHTWTKWITVTAHMDSPLMGWIKGKPVTWTQPMQVRKCVKCEKIKTRSV